MKTSAPPVIQIDKHDPLQDYYRDIDGNLYAVARLIDASKNLPVFDCPLAALDLSCEIWRGSNMLSLAWHVQCVNDADVNVPILLDWNGVIADGRHRVIKALTLGKKTIKARRMTWQPESCGKEAQ